LISCSNVIDLICQSEKCLGRFNEFQFRFLSNFYSTYSYILIFYKINNQEDGIIKHNFQT